MNYKDFSRTQDIIFEMLRDRNYIADEGKKITFDEFQQEENDFFLIFGKDKTKIIIIWHIEEKLGLKTVKNCCVQLKDNNIKNAIIIKYGKLTPPAKATISESASLYKIRVFDVEDLKINITKHSLVPKHECLSKDEEDKLLKTYKLKKTQLPRMLNTEPVVMYYDWNRGDIIKITRNDGEIYYRCIV